MTIFTVLKDHFCKSKESEGWTLSIMRAEKTQVSGVSSQVGWLREGACGIGSRFVEQAKKLNSFLNVELQGLWHTEMEANCGQMSQERNLG